MSEIALVRGHVPGAIGRVVDCTGFTAPALGLRAVLRGQGREMKIDNQMLALYAMDA